MTLGVSPELRKTFGQQIIDAFRDTPVNPLHHLRQTRADPKVSERVIVIVQQRSDPGLESELPGVFLKLLPENRFCLFGRKCMKTVSAFRRDEIDLVIDKPVFVTVFIFVFRRVASGEFVDTLEHDISMGVEPIH